MPAELPGIRGAWVAARQSQGQFAVPCGRNPNGVESVPKADEGTIVELGNLATASLLNEMIEATDDRRSKGRSLRSSPRTGKHGKGRFAVLRFGRLLHASHALSTVGVQSFATSSASALASQSAVCSDRGLRSHGTRRALTVRDAQCANPADVARIVRAQEDAANGGLRREPELPEHVAVAPETAAPPAHEFAIVDDDPDDAARQAAVRRRMQGLARQASLDPGDGIEL